ncbi:MAG: sialate O-acetylesterase [Akkermansiaceae bacterium]|nr:sialate O-acetylesterase [Akkermansiaceae bacterium]
MKSLIPVSCFAMVFASFSAANPLKVYILAGQSNMEGHAKLSSFDHIGMDPKTAPILKEMRGASGEPVELEDVWITYRTGKEEDQPGVGKLTAGFGARRVSTEDGGKIGPEFTFGIYTRKLVNKPILIIKTAWGGKSINTDFRPPSAGPYQFNKKQLETFKKQGKDIAKMKAERNAKVGHYYRMMMDHVRSVLNDPGKVHPGYNAEDGYELGGFVWFQGWNDMVDSGTYPDRGNKGGYDKYSEVMAHFIRDVRRELKSPKLPFVIGVMGAGGPTDLYGPRQKRYKNTHQYFRDSMAAPASLPEFKGNVTAVLTEKYWDLELDAVDQKRGELRSKEKELKEEGLSKKEISNQLKGIEAKLFTARDRELLKGITNADYHYKGSAKIMAQIGKAFAEALEGFKK